MALKSICFNWSISIHFATSFLFRSLISERLISEFLCIFGCLNYFKIVIFPVKTDHHLLDNSRMFLAALRSPKPLQTHPYTREWDIGKPPCHRTQTNQRQPAHYTPRSPYLAFAYCDRKCQKSWPRTSAVVRMPSWSWPPTSPKPVSTCVPRTLSVIDN